MLYKKKQNPQTQQISKIFIDFEINKELAKLNKIQNQIIKYYFCNKSEL